MVKQDFPNSYLFCDRFTLINDKIHSAKYIDYGGQKDHVILLAEL